EDVLEDWLKYLATTGHPVSKQAIKQKVFVLAGKEPGTNWVNRFLQRHRSIKLGRPSQLDPK
ncbi:hypothetical protein SCLCIDRAFT_36466, partial [Scleroderma citrinum Foug A]